MASPVCQCHHQRPPPFHQHPATIRSPVFQREREHAVASARQHFLTLGEKETGVSDSLTLSVSDPLIFSVSDSLTLAVDVPARAVPPASLSDCNTRVSRRATSRHRISRHLAPRAGPSLSRLQPRIAHSGGRMPSRPEFLSILRIVSTSGQLSATHQYVRDTPPTTSTVHHTPNRPPDNNNTNDHVHGPVDQSLLTVFAPTLLSKKGRHSEGAGRNMTSIHSQPPTPPAREGGAPRSKSRGESLTLQST